MNFNEKGRAVFSKENFQNGDIVCRYEGELCSYTTMHKRNKEYEICGAGCYISEFKFQEKCYIVGLGLNCKFIDLLFKRLVIIFIKISSLHNFIVLEIIYSQTDTLTEELMELR